MLFSQTTFPPNISCIILGRYSERIGKAIMSAIGKKSAMMKGITPRKMEPSGTPLTPLRMKHFIPTGGLMAPTSVILTSTTPNQIGSKPRATTIGTIRTTRQRRWRKSRTLLVRKYDNRIAIFESNITGRHLFECKSGRLEMCILEGFWYIICIYYKKT